MEQPTGTARTRYSELSASREPFLKRARDCAKFTIPALLPPDGFNGTSDLYKPYQSIGARGVNNLASKLVMVLLPPTQTFFRLHADPSEIKNVDPSLHDAIDTALSEIEQKILTEIESRGTRVHSFESFKHLIVAGNVLMYVPRDGTGARVFSLSQYVVCRDGEGNPLEIIVQEKVSPRLLPAGFRETVKAEMKENEKNVELYTVVELGDDGKTWQVHQEVMDKTVPGSSGSYPADKLPWMPLRWTRIDGEDYGRGLCDEYIGDLLSLEGLSESIVDAAAACARVLFLVRPNAVLSAKDLEETPNCGVREGEEGDVTTVQTNKTADMTVAANTAAKLESRLSYAFLMNSAIQRDGERVTAEEIRYMANEIENALGGVYSILSTEFQRPLVSVIKSHMEAKGKIPPLPQGTVNLTIITGLDALGRSQELIRLDSFIDGIEQRFPQEGAARINISVYMKRRAAALGIEDNGLIYTEEQVAATRQQAMQQQQMSELANRVAPNVVNAVSQHMQQANEAAAQQTGEQQ